MKLAIGPVQYYWARDALLAFYRELALAAVDIVYLGETVCSRRHEMKLRDWLDIAEHLAAAGKEVVLSTLALVESESDLKAVRRIARNGTYAVEANDMGAVRRLSGTPFVAGASLNLYNAESVCFMLALGAKRWVTPTEMSRTALAMLQSDLPAKVETEMIAYGRHALAHSARCFTARHFNLQKDACEFKCLDFPEGLLARTRELTPLLVLNGVQTQSAGVCNLASALPDMAAAGIDIIRIYPTRSHIVPLIELFRRALTHPREVESIAREMDELTREPACNGFWYGDPGMAFHGSAVRGS